MLWGLYFNPPKMAPCALCHLKFDMELTKDGQTHIFHLNFHTDLPEDDDIPLCRLYCDVYMVPEDDQAQIYP